MTTQTTTPSDASTPHDQPGHTHSHNDSDSHSHDDSGGHSHTHSDTGNTPLSDAQIDALPRLYEIMLRNLGHHIDLPDFPESLRECGLDTSGLLRQEPLLAYPVDWPKHGLSVLMEPIKPKAGQEKHTWGLQCFTLQAGRWRGPWPKDMDPKTVTMDQMISLLVDDKNEMASAPTILCCRTPAINQPGKYWGAVVRFNSNTGKLYNLALTRYGEWAPSASSAAQTTHAVASTEPVTCRTGDVIPRTGWYEGRLPSSHPRYILFSNFGGRFVKRQEGQRMSRLGVGEDADEMQVVWTWRGEQKPE